MENISFFDSTLFTWVVLPTLIFIARIFDVSLGTIRIILISRGTKYLAPTIAFFEILIWLLAIGQIMKNLNNIACFIAYAGGFAMGNYVGILIEEKIALGVLMVRVVTRKPAFELVSHLDRANFGVTSVDAESPEGPVNVVYTIIKRSDLQQVIEIIKRFNPQAFYSIENIKFVSEVQTPDKTHRSKYFERPPWLLRRKAK
jgi:uncharacterized protein YebE (UPF0316 family)